MYFNGGPIKFCLEPLEIQMEGAAEQKMSTESPVSDFTWIKINNNKLDQQFALKCMDT